MRYGAPMRFFDVGQEAHGFIAIGQLATGFLAIGQLATGVIAIGQVARGVFCVGMASVGLFSMGMATAGVVAGVGMVGVAGVGGRGLVLPLFPFPPKRRRAPATGDYAAIVEGRSDGGWVEAEVRRGMDGRPALFRGAEAVPAGFVVELTRATEQLATAGGGKILARLARKDGALVCDRLHERPAIGLSPAFVVTKVCQSILLLGLVALFYELVLLALFEDVVGPLLAP